MDSLLRMCLVLALSVMLVPAAVDKAEASLPLSDKTSTADHTQFKALQGRSAGSEVTQACCAVIPKRPNSMLAESALDLRV